MADNWTVDDDILIYIFAFLSVPEILSLRQTCWRIYRLSSLRIIWQNACKTEILQPGYPFPNLPITSLDSSELERRTRHAYRLSRKWLSPSCEPQKMVIFDATSTTSVSDLRFLPGHDGTWLLTVSKGIWSVITIWDISDGLRKLSEWGPKGALFNGFALNADPSSQATLAVSIFEEGWQRIEILSLQSDADNSNATLQTLSTIDTSYKPVAISGDIIAFCDDCAETVIWNWKEGTYATLRHLQDQEGVWQHDRCIKVVFAHKSILVVRARSIHLFPEPTLASSDGPPPRFGPIARHSFGWIDGVAVTLNLTPHLDSLPYDSLSILIRSESDDPWASEVHSLDLYILEPNPAFARIESEEEDHSDIPPYIFPPRAAKKVPSSRGSLRCTDVILGRYGTAVWIHPQDRAVSGLISSDVHLQDMPIPETHETLVAAVFPGPLNQSGHTVTTRTLWINSFNNWTSLDYDEELGRIALGSSYGRVTILDL